MDKKWPLVLTPEVHKKYLKRLLNHKIPVGSLDTNRYKTNKYFQFSLKRFVVSEQF